MKLPEHFWKVRARSVLLSVISFALISSAVLVVSNSECFAAGDREGWRHYKDEGSKHEVFGDFAGAERAYTKSLSLATPPNANAAQRAEVTARLANAMIWQQKYDAAEPFFNELIKVIPGLKQAGKPSEDFFSCVEALANAYFEGIQGVKRIGAIQHSIRLIDTAFGDLHPALGKELVALSSTYAAVGMNQEALTFARRALSVSRRDQSDKGRSKYAKAVLLVGMCRKSVGDWQGAREDIENALSILERAHKRTTLTFASACAELSVIYYHLAKVELSKKYFKEAAAILVPKLAVLDGLDKRKLATTGPELLPFAEMYLAFKQYDKAEPVCKRAIVWTQAGGGAKDPNLIKEHRVYGYVLTKMGRLSEAAKEEALASNLADEFKSNSK